MTDTYRDWIPAGEETGAQGNVFKDFVPETKPKAEVKPEAKVEAKVETKSSFVCDVCGFVAKTEFGLNAHKRKHVK